MYWSRYGRAEGNTASKLRELKLFRLFDFAQGREMHWAERGKTSLRERKIKLELHKMFIFSVATGVKLCV